MPPLSRPRSASGWKAGQGSRHEPARPPPRRRRARARRPWALAGAVTVGSLPGAPRPGSQRGALPRLAWWSRPRGRRHDRSRRDEVADALARARSAPGRGGGRGAGCGRLRHPVDAAPASSAHRRLDTVRPSEGAGGWPDAGVVSAQEPVSLHRDTAIHDDVEAAVLGDRRGLPADDPELEPEDASARRDRLMGMRRTVLGATEDIDDLERS